MISNVRVCCVYKTRQSRSYLYFTLLFVFCFFVIFVVSKFCFSRVPLDCYKLTCSAPRRKRVMLHARFLRLATCIITFKQYEYDGHTAATARIWYFPSASSSSTRSLGRSIACAQIYIYTFFFFLFICIYLFYSFFKRRSKKSLVKFRTTANHRDCC